MGKALTLGALLLFGSSGAGLGLGGYACPHHDHGDAPDAHEHPLGSSRAHAPAGERAGGGHAHGGSVPGSPTTCTCVGSCHAGSATPGLADKGEALPPPRDARQTRRSASGEGPLTSPVPFLLPLANAPPLGA